MGGRPFQKTMAVIRYSRVCVLCGVMLAVTVALSASITLDGFFYAERMRVSRSSDVFSQMFGALRGDLAAMAYLKADEYYHGGTTHQEHDEHVIEDDAAQGVRSYEPSHAEHETARSSVGLQWIDRAVHEHPVMHLGGKQEAEFAQAGLRGH